MNKRVSVFEPIGNGERDRGEKNIILLLSGDGIKQEKGFKKITLYEMSNIDYVDYYRSDEVSNDAARGAAVAGFLAAGVIGAAVGGIANAGKKDWYCEIYSDGKSKTYRFYNEQQKNAFAKWAEEYNLLK